MSGKVAMRIAQFSILTCLILALLASPAYSAEPDEGVTTAPPEEKVASETEKASTDTETSEPVEDRFIPSSQISEDLSVSFPVNI